jgi:hypothetical protein
MGFYYLFQIRKMAARSKPSRPETNNATGEHRNAGMTIHPLASAITLEVLWS